MKIGIYLRIIVPIFAMLLACKNVGVGNRNESLDIMTTKVVLDPLKLGEISIADLIDTVWYVALETKENSVIGRIDKVLFTNDRIFISDTEITQTIFCFDYSGHFIFKIQERGRGPNQYLTLTAFDVDAEKEKVLIYDAQQKAFLEFDFSGNFISRHVHGFVFDDFRVLNDNTIIAYTQYIPNPGIQDNPNSSIFIFDYRSRKSEEALLLFDGDLALFNKIQGLINYISSRELSHYIYDYYTNSIYSYENGIFSKKWEIDFSTNSIPKEFWSDATFNSHMEGIRNGNFCGGLINYQVLKDWVIGIFSCLSKSNVFVYNITNESAYIVNDKIFSDKSGFPIFLIPPFHSTGNEIIAIIEPAWVAKIFDSNVPKSIIPSVLMSSGINSNPILQIIKLK